MQYSSSSTASPTAYATHNNHYGVYAPTPQKSQQAHWAADPRSVPTPPISNQPRKKSRVTNSSPDSYSNKRGPSSHGDFAASYIKEEPRTQASPNCDLDNIGGYGEVHESLRAGAGNGDYWTAGLWTGPLIILNELKLMCLQGSNYSTARPERTTYSRESTIPIEFGYSESQYSNSG